MDNNVYGHVVYQNKMISDLLLINTERLRDFVDVETLGVWGVCDDEIVYICSARNDHLPAKDIGLSLINLVRLLGEKCIFCDGNVAIADREEVVYVKIQKNEVQAQYRDLTEFSTSI